VQSGGFHVLGITTGGLLRAWGDNGGGQVGDGTTINRSTVTNIGTSSWTAVAAGYAFSLAIRTDGALFVWGGNGNGQLGDGTTVNKSSPIQIGTSSWIAIAGGQSHAMALRSDGGLFTWGLGSSGQLGSGSTLSRSSPVQVGTSSWTVISAGPRHSAAIRSDGALFTWGTNGVSGGGSGGGQLGDGTTIDRSSPVQIGSSSWTTVSAGGDNSSGITFAIRTDNALYAWGANGSGQLGISTTGNRSSPTLVATAQGLTGTLSWYAIGSTKATTQGGIISQNGTYGQAQFWGDSGLARAVPAYFAFLVPNSADQTTSPLLGWTASDVGERRSSPVQIGSGSWSAISAGQFNMVAKTSTGTLFAWGYNQNGQCGVGFRTGPTEENVWSPLQIGSSSWTAVSCGWNHSTAIASNNYLFAWGVNSSGELGDGTIINRSSPVQIGTSSWVAIANGNAFSLGLKS
jgi:alpha-tubulin suppressor-like RCC1 family protein